MLENVKRHIISTPYYNSGDELTHQYKIEDFIKQHLWYRMINLYRNPYMLETEIIYKE